MPGGLERRRGSRRRRRRAARRARARAARPPRPCVIGAVEPHVDRHRVARRTPAPARTWRVHRISSSWRILRRLADELPLLRRVARLLHRAGERDHVAGDRLGPTPRRARRAPSSAPARRSASALAGELRPLLVELVRCPACPAPDTDWYVDTTMRSMPRGAVQRRERGDRDHRRAVRARRDALAAGRAGRRGSPRRPRAARRGPCGTRPSCRRPARPPRRPAAPTRARAGRRRRRSRGRGRRSSRRRSTSHVDLAARERQLAALGARRRVRAQLVDRERALLEDAQHLGADQAGRARSTPTLTRACAHAALELERARAAPAPRARRRSPAPRTRCGSSTCGSSRC